MHHAQGAGCRMSALCSVVYGVGFAKLCVYSSAALWFRNNPAHLNLIFIFVQIACSSIISTEALGYAQSQYFHADGFLRGRTAPPEKWLHYGTDLGCGFRTLRFGSGKDLEVHIAQIIEEKKEFQGKVTFSGNGLLRH